MLLLSRQCWLSSEVEEEGLSLTEYIHMRQEEERAGPKKKRVSSQCIASIRQSMYGCMMC